MFLNSDDRELLVKGLKILGLMSLESDNSTGIEIPSSNFKKVELFSRFIQELLQWNEKTNLIGTVNTSELIIRHIFDSLCVYHLLKDKNRSILDIGAGAGFPSVPLAIIDEKIKIDAVEKRHKRASFLRSVAVILQLKNFRVIEKDIRHIKGRYDIALARGVGELFYLHELTRGILKENAMIIAFKGKITEIEKEVSRLKGKNSKKNIDFNIQRVKVPYLDEEERNIVIIETK
jgi:16S rRNA (guanine527-N7)-methyltransferase